ncbi:MAG: hypothetical protein AB1305_02000 [Candidatus Hadarchaeota archaeon]
MKLKKITWFVLGTIVIFGVIVGYVFTRQSADSVVDYAYLTFSAKVLDGMAGAGENYTNENVIITFSTGWSALGYVGHPENGLAISLSKSGWGPFVPSVKGHENYENGYVEENGYWTVSTAQNAYIRWSLNVQVTQFGRLEYPGTGNLYLWADTNANEVDGYGMSSKPPMLLWDAGDNLRIRAWSEGFELTGSANVGGGVTILLNSENR